MSNYIVVRTRTEEPQCFLYQGQSEESLTSSLRVDPSFFTYRGTLFTFKVDSNQKDSPFGGVRLQAIAHSTRQNASERFFQESLYYARINGSKPESEQLEELLSILTLHLQQARDREARVAAPAKPVPPSEETNVQTSTNAG